MTRSDIIIRVSRLNKMTEEEKTLFIMKLYHKIEEVYTILFELEKTSEWEPLSQLLRKALESE